MRLSNDNNGVGAYSDALKKRKTSFSLENLY
jgi:hypothetical protein